MAVVVDLALRKGVNLERVAALDGLRGVAVLGVMLFHLKSKPLIPGGFIGVDVFFALSGFLITTLLLQEFVVKGTISLRGFYWRRAVRLLPPLFAFLVVYAFVTLAFSTEAFTGRLSTEKLSENILYISGYSFNWLIVDTGMRGPGIGHLWSLSVEEQFYLVWPAILLVLLRLRVSLSWIVAITGTVVFCSTVFPYFLEPSFKHFYYGTDYRLQAILGGALVAYFYVGGLLQPGSFNNPLGRGIGLTCCVFLGFVLFVHEDPARLTYLGYSLVSATACLLVAFLVGNPAGIITTLLGSKVIVYFGTRSYALYLWHNLIGGWLRSLDAVDQVVLTLVLSMAAAELSFRLLEQPASRLKTLAGRKSKPAMEPAVERAPRIFKESERAA